MKLSEINKAVTAGAGALAGMEGIANMANAAHLPPYIHLAAVGFSILVSAATWVVRNKTTVDQVLSAFDDDTEVAEAVTEKVTDAPASVDAVVAKHPSLAEELIAAYNNKQQ